MAGTFLAKCPLRERNHWERTGKWRIQGESGAPYLTLPHDGEIMNNLINVSCPQVGSINPTNRGYLEIRSKRSISRKTINEFRRFSMICTSLDPSIKNF